MRRVKRHENRSSLLVGALLLAAGLATGCSLIVAKELDDDYCGDGKVDMGEMCDEEDLDGRDCHSLGYNGGNLSCQSDCKFNVTSCIDPFGLHDGEACLMGDECKGKICWSPDSGHGSLLGGYCTGECPFGVCPGGGVCIVDGEGDSGPFCYKRCDYDTDCRDIHLCYDQGPDYPEYCWRR